MFLIMIETVCSTLKNTQKMWIFFFGFWSWLADKLAPFHPEL